MIDKTALDALEGDRTAARTLLTEIARGEFYDDARLYLQEVAARILEADDELDDKRRADRIMKALGLGGRVDRKRDLRRLVAALHGLDGFNTAAIVLHARRRHLIADHVDDAAAGKLVRSLVPK